MPSNLNRPGLLFGLLRSNRRSRQPAKTPTASRALFRSWLFVVVPCALGVLTSGCGLVGEKEPGVITASLGSSSSAGCLDSLEKKVMAAWDGNLSETEIRGTASCTRQAVNTLIHQIEGADSSQSLNPAEFRSFLNGLLFHDRPLSQDQADRLLRFKSYFLGGSDREWADSDSRNLLPLITLAEEELVYWIPLIHEFRNEPNSTTWERLKARSRQTADRLEESLLATSGQATLSADDIVGMLEDLMTRMESQTGESRPAWLQPLAPWVNLFLRAKFLLAGGAADQLEPESRARLAGLALRIAPFALGKSLDEGTQPSMLSILWTRVAGRGQTVARTELETFLLEDALAEMPQWIASDGDSVKVATLLQWARELPATLAPASLEEALPQAEKWTAWIKPLTIGGDPDSISRRELRRAATIAARILPAIRSGSANAQNVLDTQPVLEAFLQGWNDIIAEDAAALKLSVPEVRIVSLLEKVSREEWEKQPAPGTLAAAVRLARFSLEGPTNGTLDDAMPWERWLEMLRVASVIQGPVFDTTQKPEANLDLLNDILGKVVEGTHCSTAADRPCIPLHEVHSFFLNGEKAFGDQPLTLSEAGALKQILIGGSPHFISREELKALQATLKRLRPALLDGLRGDFDSSWVARHFRELWKETQLRHPTGIPSDALRSVLEAGILRTELRRSFSGESLSDLVLLTLTGTGIPANGAYPAASWSLLGDTLADWMEMWWLAPERSTPACRGLPPGDRFKKDSDCWASFRRKIAGVPAAFPGKRIPWPVIDQWLRVAAANDWLPEGVTADELSALVRSLAAGFARSSLDMRGKGLSQKALSKMMETAAVLVPVLESTRALSANPNLDDPAFWVAAEAEIQRWKDALENLEPLFPAGSGIPLWAYAEIINALPAQWFTLDRKLVLASSGPFFQKIWVCGPGESLCPSGLIGILESVQQNVRAEQLAARFAEQYPENAAYPRESWLDGARRFGETLADDLDQAIWARWIEVAVTYPDLFLKTGGQALFQPSSVVHASNVRTYFHLETASDYILSAYSESHTPLPASFAAFVQMADDFDDLAKAFKVIESRTPELAPTRFREANLFSPHGNGDDWLDRRELTGYLSLIMSAKTFTHRMTGTLTPPCALPDGSVDLLGQPILDMVCFRNGLTRTLRSDLLDHLPGLLEDWGRWNEGDERRFIDAMELAGREKGHGDAPISVNDIDGISSLLQYLEVLTLRFDHDHDGALNEREVHEMFPVVRATIAAAVIDQGSESIAGNAEMLESLFTWVLTRKTLPRGPLPVKFLQWHQARQTRKFTIRRLDAMIAISVLIGPPVSQ